MELVCPKPVVLGSGNASDSVDFCCAKNHRNLRILPACLPHCGCPQADVLPGFMGTLGEVYTQRDNFRTGTTFKASTRIHSAWRWDRQCYFRRCWSCNRTSLQCLYMYVSTNIPTISYTIICIKFTCFNSWRSQSFIDYVHFCTTCSRRQLPMSHAPNVSGLRALPRIISGGGLRIKAQ